MGGTFSSSSSSSSSKTKAVKQGPSDQDRAILDLKNSRDRLKKYQRKMADESAKLQSQAIALHKAGKKDRALLCMKMKKFKEKKVGEVDDQLLNLEQMVQTIQWETETLKVYTALKEGNKALDAIHSVMSVEKVEELMDDTAEAIQVSNEISELLAGEDLGIDDDAVDAELAALEKEVLGGQEQASPGQVPVMPAVPDTPVLPQVPTTEPQVAAQAAPAPEPMLA